MVIQFLGGYRLHSKYFDPEAVGTCIPETSETLFMSMR
jgi:hypothetical protein